MNTVHILTKDGEIVECEWEAGVQYRTVPTRYLPIAYQTDDAPLVYEVMDSVVIRPCVATRDDARKQLRGAGIFPEPKLIDSYMRERKMTEGDKRRHERKVAEKVREATQLDRRAEREVEGK